MVNENYVKDAGKIKNVFEKEGVVTLFNFFDETEYLELQKKLTSLKFKHEKKLTSHSYASTILKDFFDESFVTFITAITNKKLNSTTAYKLKWKDYSILHDDKKQTLGVEIIIDFTDDWPENAGGNIMYKEDEVSLAPRGNSVTIINNTGHRFFQYVNHYGQNNQRLFLILDTH